MKKIRLDLDELAVDSFSTTRGPVPALGTIHGHGFTDPVPISLPPTMGDPCNPQSQSCETHATNCFASCHGTCHDATCVSCAFTCPDPIGPGGTNLG